MTLLSWLSPKVENGMHVSQMQGGAKYCNMPGIPICHFMQRYSYGESRFVGSLLGSTLKSLGLGLGTCFFGNIL